MTKLNRFIAAIQFLHSGALWHNRKISISPCLTGPSNSTRACVQ